MYLEDDSKEEMQPFAYQSGRLSLERHSVIKTMKVWQRKLLKYEKCRLWKFPGESIDALLCNEKRWRWEGGGDVGRRALRRTCTRVLMITEKVHTPLLPSFIINERTLIDTDSYPAFYIEPPYSLYASRFSKTLATIFGSYAASTVECAVICSDSTPCTC